MPLGVYFYGAACDADSQGLSLVVGVEGGLGLQNE